MLRKHEDAGTLDNAKYQQAKKFFLTKHMCRITPLPEDLMASLVGLQKDPTVNHTMYFLSFPF
jgi:L-proline amide hydrolase